MSDFNGTANSRQRRVLVALMQRRQLFREEVDAAAGASNGPQVIKIMRDRLGLDLPCERVIRIDRDGRQCKPGIYRLSERDRAKVAAWLANLKGKG